MKQRVTPAELAALLKPRGKPRVNRASRSDRTYRGVVYDSASEARYAQACDLQGVAYERQKKYPLLSQHGEIVRYLRVDFFHPASGIVVEIKSGKRDKNGNYHGWWSEASKLAWRWFRACWPDVPCKVLAWEKGGFREVTPK